MVAHECWGGGEEGRRFSKLYIMYKLLKLLTEGHDSH